MDFLRTVLCACLLCAGTASLTACSGNGVGIGLPTGSNPAKKEEAVAVVIPDLTDRPAQVAFISACAQAYGFEVDTGKIRAGYISYEQKHGAAPAQLGEIERRYDFTYQAIGALGHRQTGFCATKDGEEVRAELRRFSSGFYEQKGPLQPAQTSYGKSREPPCTGQC